MNCINYMLFSVKTMLLLLSLLLVFQFMLGRVKLTKNTSGVSSKLLPLSLMVNH